MSPRIALLFLWLGCSVAEAEKLSNDDLLGVWEARFASAHQDSKFGEVKWIQITFLEDNRVEWTWERQGKNTSHKGKYSISITPSKDGALQTSVIEIIPITTAVYRNILLRKPTIDHDSRFPLPEKVLKCHDYEGNPLVFSRKR